MEPHETSSVTVGVVRGFTSETGIVCGRDDDSVAVAEWLTAQIFRPENERQSPFQRTALVEAAKVLFRHLLNANTDELLPAGGKFASTFIFKRSRGLWIAHAHLASIVKWLAVQILTSNDASVFSAGKLLFEGLVGPDDNDDNYGENAERFRAAGLDLDRYKRMRAKKPISGRAQAYFEKVNAARCEVENALIWVLLHSRPPESLKLQQRRGLLPANENRNAAKDWAASILDTKIIRPALRGEEWFHRCRKANDPFGFRLQPQAEGKKRHASAFSFEDDCAQYIWERIAEYDGRDFQAWLVKRLKEQLGDATPQVDATMNATVARRGSRPPRPLSKADETILWGWAPIDGVLMACTFDLCKDIPPTMWTAWLNRLKISPRDLEFGLAKINPLECRTLLADLTMIKRNTLDRRWRRLLPKLAQLQILRSEHQKSAVPLNGPHISPTADGD